MNYSHRSPTGNRHMRRVLNQAANSAVKVSKEVSSRLCIAAPSRAWDITKPSGQLPIDSAD